MVLAGWAMCWVRQFKIFCSSESSEFSFKHSTNNIGANELIQHGNQWVITNGNLNHVTYFTFFLCGECTMRNLHLGFNTKTSPVSITTLAKFQRGKSDSMTLSSGTWVMNIWARLIYTWLLQTGKTTVRDKRGERKVTNKKHIRNTNPSQTKHHLWLYGELCWFFLGCQGLRDKTQPSSPLRAQFLEDDLNLPIRQRIRSSQEIRISFGITWFLLVQWLVLG